MVEREKQLRAKVSKQKIEEWHKLKKEQSKKREEHPRHKVRDSQSPAVMDKEPSKEF